MPRLGFRLGHLLGNYTSSSTTQPPPANGPYETWARSLRFSWMDPVARNILGTFGRVLGDYTLRDLKNAVLQGMPSCAGEDALGLLANDRSIERGPGETVPGFAARLVAAVTQWKKASTPTGLLVQLFYNNFPGAVLVQQNGYAITLTGTPVLSDLDLPAMPSWVSRVDVGANPYVPASTDGKPAIPAGTIPWWTFDSGMDAAGNQYNSRFGILFPTTDPQLGTAANLARLSRIVAKWKPAKAKCMGAWVSSNGYMWGFPATDQWGTQWGGAWGGGGTTVTYYAV